MAWREDAEFFDAHVRNDLTVTGKATLTGGARLAPVALADDTTYAVLAANSGKLHVVPDLTADDAIALPTAAAGLNFKFIYGGAATDGQNWVITSTGVFKGGVVHLDADADDSGDEVVPVIADGSGDNTLTVVTPDAGTQVSVVCDGTDWYVDGVVVSATVPTFTTV